MQTFTFEMIETVALARIYTVEAATQQEAEEMALRGETVNEITIDTIGVIDRQIDTES